MNADRCPVYFFALLLAVKDNECQTLAIDQQGKLSRKNNELPLDVTNFATVQMQTAPGAGFMSNSVQNKFLNR